MVQRLDKLLSSQGKATRRDAQKLIHRGKITVNGLTVRDPSEKVDPYLCEISFNGEIINYRKFIYIMLNKPAGLLCVSRDPKAPTVMELLPDSLRRPGLFPAGRLDKDTVGMVIITDDGEFAHRMLAPKKDIVKRYQAVLDNPVGNPQIDAFASGTSLGDGTICKPAQLRIIKEEANPLVEVAITEGRYHQVKRMFSSVDRHVLWLKRISIGNLKLDPLLAEGKCRELTESEKDSVFE